MCMYNNSIRTHKLHFFSLVSQAPDYCLKMFTMELLYKFCQELLEAAGASPPIKSLPPSSSLVDEIVIVHHSSETKVRFADAADMMTETTSINATTSPIELLMSSKTTKLSWDGACQLLWYTESELHTFKTVARRQLLLQHNKDQIISSIDDLRGLERYNYERSRYKDRIRKSILQVYHTSRVQQHNYSFEINNANNGDSGDTDNDGNDETENSAQQQQKEEELLRRISCDYTKWSRRIAYYQGRRDESIVRRWQQEEKEQKILLKMRINRRSSSSCGFCSWRRTKRGKKADNNRRASSSSSSRGNKAANGIIIRKLGNYKNSQVAREDHRLYAANTSVQNNSSTTLQ